MQQCTAYILNANALVQMSFIRNQMDTLCPALSTCQQHICSDTCSGTLHVIYAAKRLSIPLMGIRRENLFLHSWVHHSLKMFSQTSSKVRKRHCPSWFPRTVFNTKIPLLRYSISQAIDLNTKHAWNCSSQQAVWTVSATNSSRPVDMDGHEHINAKIYSPVMHGWKYHGQWHIIWGTPWDPFPLFWVCISH